jgi:hypothetical protein
MKSNSLILLSFSTLLLLGSCSRADLDVDDIYHFWMAMSIQAEDTIEPSPANRGKVKSALARTPTFFTWRLVCAAGVIPFVEKTASP